MAPPLMVSPGTVCLGSEALDDAGILPPESEAAPLNAYCESLAACSKIRVSNFTGGGVCTTVQDWRYGCCPALNIPKL